MPSGGQFASFARLVSAMSPRRRVR
jgi:hypothetical protein